MHSPSSRLACLRRVLHFTTLMALAWPNPWCRTRLIASSCSWMPSAGCGMYGCPRLKATTCLMPMATMLTTTMLTTTSHSTPLPRLQHMLHLQVSNNRALCVALPVFAACRDALTRRLHSPPGAKADASQQQHKQKQKQYQQQQQQQQVAGSDEGTQPSAATATAQAPGLGRGSANLRRVAQPVVPDMSVAKALRHVAAAAPHLAPGVATGSNKSRYHAPPLSHIEASYVILTLIHALARNTPLDRALAWFMARMEVAAAPHTWTPTYTDSVSPPFLLYAHTAGLVQCTLGGGEPASLGCGGGA